MSSSTSPSNRSVARSPIATIVLSILFFSLVILYIITPEMGSTGFLAIALLIFSLGSVLYGNWRGVTVVSVIAGLVSVYTAALVGRMWFGTLGSVLVALLWLAILYLVFRSARSSNVLLVPEDRVILIRNIFTGAIRKAYAFPISLPPIPGIEEITAEIPLYRMTSDVPVENINTKPGHNISKIVVQVHYHVDPDHPELLDAELPNRGLFQKNIATGIGQNDVDMARHDMIYWERLIQSLISATIDDVTRQVIFLEGTGATTNYTAREDLAGVIRKKLETEVRSAGVVVSHLWLETFDVPENSFKNPHDPDRLEKETKLKQIEAEREANRLRVLLSAAADVEKKRLSQIIEELQKTDQLTPETLADAVRAASDWVIDGEYTLMPPDPPKAAPNGDKKDSKDGGKK